jgi:hypothetical protein
MKTILGILAALGAIFTVLYAARPDFCAAVTILPSWVWPALLLPVLPFVRRRHLRPAAVCVGIWVVFAVLHVEEPRSMTRGLFWPVSLEKPDGLLRIVTCNCGAGRIEALDDVKALRPDIVCLQESPRREAVADFARALFGGEGACVWNVDTSVVGRNVSRRAQDPQDRMPLFTSVDLSLPEAGNVQVISVRLWPGSPRIDLWNPACWRSQREHRLRQSEEMTELASSLDDTVPTILAGDFNVPQGDKVFSLLPDTFTDTFRARGKGIGNTILNDAPVLRIDQIWVSRHFETIQSFAVKSRASDHRMVVTDVRVK